MIAFQDQFFYLFRIFSFTFKKITCFNPFEHFAFWYDSKDTSTLMITSRVDFSHVGLRIFRINIIPENVHESLNHFIKVLSNEELMIKFTFQIVHSPIINLYNSGQEFVRNNLSPSFQTFIYICVYNSVYGILSKRKYFFLKDKLISDFNFIKGNLVADFHHFNISLLTGGELINAVRLFFFQGIKYSPPTQDTPLSKKRNVMDKVLKSVFLLFLIYYSNYILISFNLSIGYILVIDLILSLIFILLMWRSLLPFKVFINEGIKNIDPFSRMSFYYYKEVPTSIFIHVDNKLLIDFKLFNLKFAAPLFFSYINKFIRAQLYQQVPYSYTLLNSPMTFEEFIKEGQDFLNEKTKYSLFQSRWAVKNSFEEYQWLNLLYDPFSSKIN